MFPAATNPGAFDYRRFLALQGIWVTAYANSAAEVVRMEEKKGNSFFHFVESGRGKSGNSSMKMLRRKLEGSLKL